MTRAQNGTGTIDRRGDRWRVRLSLPDGTRRALYTKPGEPYEAAVELRDAALLHLRGTVSDPKTGGVTLGAWGLRWLDQRDTTHRDAPGDRQRWGAFVAGTKLAAMRLDAIRSNDVAAWTSELVERRRDDGRPLGRQTIRNAWTTLRAAFRAACHARLISAERRAALLAVELPPSPVEADVELDERIVFLTDDELAAAFAHPKPPDAASAFVVGVFTGMRAGELHGLRWERVHLDDPIPHVVVARSRGGPTKAGVVARVPLLAPALATLRARWEAAGRPAAGLVWPAEHGGCHARGYDWGWSDHPSSTFHRFGWRRLAGIRRAVTWNAATRHTCGVHLLRGTWAPDIVPRAYRLEEVSRFLRHSSTKVTERHYAALALDALPVGPGELGPAGPDRSHTGELNPGPTVYEHPRVPRNPRRKSRIFAFITRL